MAKQPKKRMADKALVENVIPLGHAAFLTDLAARIRSAQLKAAVAVNADLMQLCWNIGRRIVESQAQDG